MASAYIFVVEIVVVSISTLYVLVSASYIGVAWKLRHNFYVAVR